MRREVFIQGEIVGEMRRRHYPVRRGPSIEVFPYPRRSRVIMGVDESGDCVYIPLPRLKISSASLPHLHRGSEHLFNVAGQRNAYSTARRRRTTTGGFIVRETGYRQKKTGGFSSPYELKRVQQIRKEEELKRSLLKMGINEHKLFLLMHSAVHSQVLLENSTPVRRLTSWKKGGFTSSKEAKIMERQRRRNRLARQGTIYRRY